MENSITLPLPSYCHNPDLLPKNNSALTENKEYIRSKVYHLTSKNFNLKNVQKEINGNKNYLIFLSGF